MNYGFCINVGTLHHKDTTLFYYVASRIVSPVSTYVSNAACGPNAKQNES